MGLQRMPLKLDGGVNFAAAPYNLEPNELLDAANVLEVRPGAIQKRPGSQQIGTTGYPSSGETLNMHTWYGPATLLLFSHAGDIWSMSAVRACTKRFDSADPDAVWDFETATDVANNPRAWAVNGVDPPQKWDGVAAGTSAWTNPPPNNASMCKIWKNRMVTNDGVVGTRLRWSDIGDPENGLPTNFIDIKSTEDDLEPVKWFEVLGDDLVVFKRDSVWVIFDDATFENRRIGTPGCEGRFMSTEVEGAVYYLNQRGLYVTDGNTEPKFIFGKVAPHFNREVSFEPDDFAKCRVFSFDRQIIVSTEGNIPHAYHLNLKRSDVEGGQWWIHDKGFVGGAYALFRFTDDLVEQLLTAYRMTPILGFNDGIYQLLGDAEGFDYTGNTSPDPVSSIVETGYRGFLTDEPFERIRRVQGLTVGDFDFQIYSDGELLLGTFSHLHTPPVSDYLNLVAGSVVPKDDTIDPAPMFSRIRPESWGRFHKFKWVSDSSDPFRLENLEVALRGGKEH